MDSPTLIESDFGSLRPRASGDALTGGLAAAAGQFRWGELFAHPCDSVYTGSSEKTIPISGLVTRQIGPWRRGWGAIESKAWPANQSHDPPVVRMVRAAISTTTAAPVKMLAHR